MPDPLATLREEYTIDTPENVAFGFEVVGIGNRFIAAFSDAVYIALLALAVGVIGLGGLDLGRALPLAEELGEWLFGAGVAVVILFEFAVFWGYHILFEWLWDGQTPGKRRIGLRVVGIDGNPVRPSQVVVRNLVRIIDFLPFAYGLGLLTMLANRHARRLGDYAAGTLVVKDRGAVTLDGLRKSAGVAAMLPLVPPADARTADAPGLSVGPAPSFDPIEDAAARARAAALARLQAHSPSVDLARLSASDYRLIRDVIERDRAARVNARVLTRLVAAVVAKLGCPPPAPSAYRRFLADVLAAGERR